MLTWLVDNATSIYLFLAAVGLVLLVAWWRTRDRRLVIGLGVVAGLALLVAFTGLLVDTDQKKIERALYEMAEGVRKRDTDRIFAHVSNDFHQDKLGDKATFRDYTDRAVRTGKVERIEIRDTERVQVSQSKGGSKSYATVSFFVKPIGDWTTAGFRCKATFVLDPDGQWRLEGFELRNPVVDTSTPIQIPDLPP